MSLRAPAAVTLAAAACALSATVAQAKVTVQGTGTATVGWTDNALSAPDQTVPGGTPRQSDGLFQLAPGVLLSQEAPRIIQRLAYTFTADLFAVHFEASSYSNRLDWLATLLTSPKTRLVFSLQSLQGRISTFTINQPSANATVGALTNNNSTNFFNQIATQSFDALPDPAWHVTQGILFTAFVPIDRGRQPDTYSVGADVGVERLFKSDGLGMVLRANFIDYVQPRDPTTDVQIGFDSRQVLTTLLARWRHDWSQSWSTEAALGVISIVGMSADPMAPTFTDWEPSALAALRWFKAFGSAELRYVHTAAPNVLIGNTFATDEAALQANVPLWRGKVLIGSTVAYQHTRVLPLTPAAPVGTADLVLFDVTVGYSPIPELRLFARYSLFDQFGELPVNGVPPLLPDLTRNLVMVGANVTYPAAPLVREPGRSTGRVDETMMEEVK